MKLSKGALVAVVDGEKLALFENTGQQAIAPVSYTHLTLPTICSV